MFPRISATCGRRHAALVAALALTVAACTAESEEYAPSAASVSVVPARSGTLIDKVVVTGAIEARDPVSIAPELTGLAITELLVDEGDRVEKGHVLARLSRNALLARLAQTDARIAEAQARVVQAEAQQRQADARHERAGRLRPSGTVSAQFAEEAEANAHVARARFHEAQQALVAAQADKRAQEVDLDRTDVRAPMAGVISRRYARLGAVGEVGPLFELTGNGDLELTGTVAQARLAQIRPQQPVLVTLPDGRRIVGRVRNVASAVETTSRLGIVRVTLAHSDDIPVGTAAVGTIETAQVTGVLVPQTSLLFERDGTFVFTVKNGAARRRQVSLGPIANGQALVVSGLRSGDGVVAAAGAFLREGDPVRAVRDRGEAL